MDSHQLVARIATLRSQVRRLLAIHGLGWVVGLMVPLVVLCGLADWLIHLDAGVRLALLIALAGCASWLLLKHVITPLVQRFDDLDIAMRIEERWPGFNDRLNSTVQFLRLGDDDDRYGSASLREQTVRQTIEETRHIDFRDAIDRQPAAKAVAVAALACIVALLIAVDEPSLSLTAIRRLFLPFGPDRWPQSTHLTLLEKETPRKIARGEPFTLAVAIGKGERLPATAHAVYRFDDGETLDEPLRSEDGGVFRGRLESVEKSFTFSVAAGDDQSSVRDIPVRVVPPPRIEEMTVRLVPPEYTRIAPVTLAPGKTQIRSVDGSRIEIAALANKPIQSATLRLGEKAATDEVSLSQARTRLKAGFTMTESTPFWFELLDTEGFRGREVTRYDARSIHDEPPRVVIDEPTNDRDVPANAVVPIQFTVDDDFGIQGARLVYTAAAGNSEPTQEVVLPLWDSGDAKDDAPVKHQQVRYSWDLAPLKLAPGSIIAFHADARDFDSIKGPNLGKSRELRLRIVSDEEIARQVDDARRAIREDIENILAMQNQARTPVDEALRTLDKTEKLPRAGVESLRNAGMIQRQVSNRINAKADGLDQKMARFLEDLQNFKIPNPDAQKQMEEMRRGVARIRDQHLEPAEQGLTRASKTLGEPSDEANAPDQKTSAKPDESGGQKSPPAGDGKTEPAQAKSGGETKPTHGEPKAGPRDAANPDKAGEPPAAAKPREPARDALAEAKTNQKAIADELQQMLDGLSEFETYRGVVKDAQNLVKEHEQVMKKAADAASKDDLTGKPADKLTADQKAELSNLAARQSSVARGLQSLQEKMQQMAKKSEEADPLAASAMRDAVEQSRKQGTNAKLGDAADQLEKNQMGAARASQEQARADLKNLVDAIQNRREHELARLVKELKNAEKEMEQLRQRQTQNLAKTRAAQKLADPKQRANELQRLAKEQQEIQKQLDRQLQRLAKLNADAAAQAGARAAGKMGQAQQNLEQDQGQQADEQQDEALADLEEAQDRIQEARREAEEQFANEQLAKMGDQLKSIAERQDKVATETTGFEKVRTEKQGKLTIGQRKSIRQLSAVQDGLKDETADLIERLEGAPVFALTLKRASSGMETAAKRLQDELTDEPTQKAARSAANRFKQLIDSLKPDKPKNGGQQGGDGGGGGGGGGQGDGIPPAAQLKMLKSLQEEINERTDYFDELKRRGKDLKPDQVAELERLQNDQGALADIVRDLTRPKMDDTEE